MPHCGAIADTAVAKISRKRWSIAWPTFSSSAVGLVFDMGPLVSATLRDGSAWRRAYRSARPDARSRSSRDAGRAGLTPRRRGRDTPCMLSDDGLDLLFRDARTHKAWLDRPVPEELLRRVYDLARLGPTSANCSPMRVLFVTSREAKERLRPALSAGQRGQDDAGAGDRDRRPRGGVLRRAAAPVPGRRHARATSRGSPSSPPRPRSATAASRAPISCWPRARSASTAGRCPASTTPRWTPSSFPDGRVKSNFLCNLGHGDASKLTPRGPRLSFDEACRIL